MHQEAYPRPAGNWPLCVALVVGGLAIGAIMRGGVITSFSLAVLSVFASLVAVIQALRRQDRPPDAPAPDQASQATSPLGVVRWGYEIVLLLAYAGLVILSLLISRLWLSLYVVHLVSGYAAGVAALIVTSRGRRRLALDWWLPAAGLALLATMGCIALRFPICLRGFDAHGFGMTGGEMNLMLLPWFQVVFYLAGWVGLRHRFGEKSHAR